MSLWLYTARLSVDLAGVATIGLAALGLLVRGHRRRDAIPVLATARRVGIILGGVWLGCTIALLWLSAAELSNRGLDVDIDAFSHYLLDVTAGKALLITAACAAGCTVITVI